MSDDDLIRRGDALHLVEDYETIHDRMSLLPAVVQETTATIRELEADRDQWRVDCEEFRRERDAAYAAAQAAVLAALPEAKALVAEAVEAERERCAKVAESYWSGIPESKVGEAVCDAVFAVAAAIRKGVTP